MGLYDYLPGTPKRAMPAPGEQWPGQNAGVAQPVAQPGQDQPGLLGGLRNALMMNQAHQQHVQDALESGQQPMSLEQFAAANGHSIKSITPR